MQRLDFVPLVFQDVSDAFGERHGYRSFHERIDSYIDVQTFDGASFADAEAECEAGFVRVAVAVRRLARLEMAFVALEIGVELEVDDARDGVGAVARRGAARDDLDAARVAVAGISYGGAFVSQLEQLGIAVQFEPAAANLAQAYEEIRQLGGDADRLEAELGAALPEELERET